MYRNYFWRGKAIACICLIAQIICFVGQKTFSQPISDSTGTHVRLNQIGFYPDGQKIAVVLQSSGGTFHLQTLSGKDVFSSELKKSNMPAFGGIYTQIADFSSFAQPGKYKLFVNGAGYSYPFEIKRNALQSVAAGSLKAFYFIRASAPIEKKYAGKWNRAEGHPDNHVFIHPSAASEKRPAGTVISSPGGWYDAGDYNKYIVNSGITTGTLLSLYEDFPDYMKTVKLNIPESGNGVPDVLNEILWNLRWMQTMQDPNDGGVYHKLTNAAFDKMEMPDHAIEPRYVVQKGTAATLDFAAVMAQAGRIFSKYKKQLPGLADSCIVEAQKAWEWAVKNPAVVYNQDEINRKFEPKVTTGAYGDRNFTDEFIWAACELFVTTRNNAFLNTIKILPDTTMPIPSWSQVKLLGYYTLVKNSSAQGGNAPKELPEIKRRLLALSDDLIAGADDNAYQTVITKSKSNFNWGSNSVAANQGIALIQAYRLSGKKKYLNYALADLDYILGRNGTGYSYLTGFGSKTPRHPHHRPSVADGIAEPVPGLLAGGPNPGMQDKIKVPSLNPDEAYVDDDRAYAVNEIAINWNAPFAYLANAIEALQQQLK
ncbi:glycoside hydrolase family 9 protein [Mucilaginibacter sp. L3T2-6]|uniref:glycoside hydrolase family 9 protein n=1 Tax=Mucilaginibacter sp. L3T2-6 TaxID=3062491 RepID=UPI002676F6B8|nr:glycoside hydrolase family 9 protein [Mucilaginibacter sp. L3T2-6]MDO3644978.1 glycoside hydrolase family 9 protein [Mucilaginibacter sp. L3T2-6]MDV6217396.1 glycoside hydrolase family 9 protein [Mucilaginibacter sp. L3T2-6]